MNTHWGGLKNPEIRDMVRKGMASPSSGVAKTEGGRYKRRYLSGFESLVYYFGEEWFDLKADRIVSTRKGWNDKKRCKSQPRRCDKCNKPWGTDPDGFYYIDSVAFVRMPCISETCRECV